VRFGFEISVHDLDLGWADGTVKYPPVAGYGCDFRDGFAPSFDAELFGDVNEVLGFVVDWVLLDVSGVHKDGRDVRFNREFSPKGIKSFANHGFRDFVPVAG
jgi:hypothetical protein